MSAEWPGWGAADRKLFAGDSSGARGTTGP